VLTEIQQRRTSSNGIFGIKLHHSHIKQFGNLQDIINFFPNACFVLLSREDVLKQAISMSIAKQTGVWISGQTAKNTNPQYNFKHINSCLKQIIIDNSTWRYLLSASGCDYIEMNFNSVQNDLAKAIVDIANFVNIDINIDDIPKKQITKKQSNNINAEWAIKFISDFDTTNKLISEPELSYFERLKNRVKKI
jgi:LPS sulfotransferase NodH